MQRSLWAAALAALTLTISASLTVASCGGGSSPGSPTPSPSPSPSPTPTPPPGGSTATITITSAGVTPRDLVVARGARVTFVNTDTVPHDMNSDPHPQHTSCLDMNVGFVAGGQRGETQVLNIARTCGYHDHNQPSNASLQGTIRIE